MRTLMIPSVVALIGSTAAFAQNVPPAAQPHDALDMPSYSEPAAKWRDIEDGLPQDPEKCAQKIRQVRSEAGKPEVKRAPADPGAPLLVAAVDERIDDCRVLVMKHDTSDIRPIPKAAEDRIVLQPVGQE